MTEFKHLTVRKSASTPFQARGTSIDLAARRRVERGRSQPRSTVLLEAISKVDTTATTSTASAAIMRWIRDEYNSRQGGVPIGLFARCYLGPPFVDHRLDLFGTICRHYTPGDVVEFPFDLARPLVRTDAYVLAEVYSDGSIAAIRPDGSAVIVQNGAES